ncbi:MAG: hypothetical protein ACR2I8_03000, partial [Steroidobacteraceae bacterium]
MLMAFVGASWQAHARVDGDRRSPACTGAGPRQAYAPGTFGGYLCREPDCAAHKAGFAWAEAGALTDIRSCTRAADPAGVEGCRAFVEDAVTPEQAGFEWARENEVADPCRCRG